MVKDCTCGDRGLCTACVLAEYDGDLGEHLMVTALDATEKALARPANVTSLHRGHSMRVMALQDREPTDDEVTRRGPYVMDSRSENDRSL